MPGSSRLTGIACQSHSQPQGSIGRAEPTQHVSDLVFRVKRRLIEADEAVAGTTDYTRAFEKDVLPLLRKQNGFKDEITFAGPGGVDVTAISLWENKKDADNYNASMYPQVLKTLARFIEGTPQVRTSDVVTSTLKQHELVTA